MTVSAAVRGKGALPTPVVLLGFVVLGVLAVLLLPEAADDLPAPGGDRAARYALTWVGVVGVTAAFVHEFSASSGGVLDRARVPAVVYGVGLAVVKFILSPASFAESSGVSFGSFLLSGLVVVPLYVGGIVVLYRVAMRREGSWPLGAKVAVAAALAAAAVVTRLTVSLVLGTADDYVESLLGPGLYLPVVVALAALAVMHAFDRSRPALAPALVQALSIVAVHHVLWVVYMYRLF